MKEEKQMREVEYRQRMTMPTPGGEITQGETYIKAKGATVEECIQLVDRFIEKKPSVKKKVKGKKK